MELFFELHDDKGVCHRKFTSEFGVETTLKQLREEIHSEFTIQPKRQHLFSVDGNEINGLGSSTLRAIGLKNADKIVVKHARIEDWGRYRSYAETVLEERKLSTRGELAKSVIAIHKTLVNTGFFEAYGSFQDYQYRNHWRVVRCLDGETEIIATASREHFLIKNALKGGSKDDFHFRHRPKDTLGSRCGIIVHVQLVDMEEEMKWQVKTHHHGGSTLSTETTGPDIRELFCYKFFELIGVGPEIQFIMPSKDSGSKTAVYIGSKWRDDFVPLSPNKNKEASSDDEAAIDDKPPIKGESLVQLHLLQVILHVEDLHGLNCGIWEESGTAAIVDFCMGVERKNSKKHFLQRYNTKLPWDDRSKELFESISREERLNIAKKWLESWNFLSKIDEADHLIAEVKDTLKKDFDTRFRGFDTDEDDEIYNAQVTDELKNYIDSVKRNVEDFFK